MGSYSQEAQDKKKRGGHTKGLQSLKPLRNEEVKPNGFSALTMRLLRSPMSNRVRYIVVLKTCLVAQLFIWTAS